MIRKIRFKIRYGYDNRVVTQGKTKNKDCLFGDLHQQHSFTRTQNTNIIINYLCETNQKKYWISSHHEKNVYKNSEL